MISTLIHISKYIRYGLLLVVLFALTQNLSLYGEGTAQWMPTGMDAGQELSLMLYNTSDGNGRLGTTGCDSLERIYIAVSSNFANERIYIGMNVFDNTDSHFRVMDPNGNQVYPASGLQEVLSNATSNTGEGYIATLTEARNGPEEVFGSGGYDAISITPTMAGNYYIEFNGDDDTTFVNEGRHQVSYFDVTVANTNGLSEGLGNHTAINGRLHSYQWGLYNLTDGLGFNDIDAEFFVYQSQDSIVTKVIWDEVRPGGFDILFTKTGLYETGDYFADRQSQPYSTLAPGNLFGEYPIFVNDPDSTIWESAVVPPELSFFDYSRCGGSTCFLYEITKGGQVEILLDFNENGIFDPNTEDVLLVDNKPAGLYCLDWDDMDGEGNLILEGQAQTTIKYQAGIIHMPLGDVEGNPNGFDRELIRPTLTGTTGGRVYHDHTVVGGNFDATDYEYEGCVSGCNVWPANDGNVFYLNTWFSYAEIRDTLFTIFDGCDTDGDGLSDDLDIDDDQDGIPDIVEFYNGDHDDDGVLDFEDPQYCTATLSGVNGWDCADGLPDPNGDLDGDGVLNAADIDFPGCGVLVATTCTEFDSDNDGFPNFLDLDSDNDGISDLIEIGGTDTNGNGRVDDESDSDFDGLADIYDNDLTDGTNGSSPCSPIPGCLGTSSTSSLIDNDADGNSDFLLDTDGDGIMDFIDLDSDDDGIPDVVEVGGVDENGDGFADNYSDQDNDGYNDVYDPQVCRDTNSNDAGTYLSGPSTGIVDGGNASGFANNDFAQVYDVADLLVIDFGTVLDVGTKYVISWRRKNSYSFGPTADMDVEESTSPSSGYSTNSVTPQTTSITDFVRDTLFTENLTRYLRISIVGGTDDDLDFDAVKYLYDDTVCITPGVVSHYSGSDTDNDGAPNSYPVDDTDGDGIRDYLDLDADNDGIPDVVEAGGTDTDGDGIFDDQTDSDNDGFADDVDGDVGNDGTAENTGDALQITGPDANVDGVPDNVVSDDIDDDDLPNQLDLDSDGDGLVDVFEVGGADVNEDGLIDNATTDTDNDGYADGVDGDVGNDGTSENSSNSILRTGSDTNNDGAPNSYPNDDFDSDGLTDQIDIDADNDGIVDNSEAQGTFAYIGPSGSDTDNDGLDNAYDPDNSGTYLIPVDTDSDTSDDYLDADSDNDGESDAIEGHDSDGSGAGDAGSPANTGVSGGTIDTDGDGLYDGWDNNTASGEATNGLTPTSHPNFDEGGTERDWREVPCAGGTVTLSPVNTTTVANEYCRNGAWTYYYNPADSTELLFAIEHFPSGGGANTNDFTASVSLTVSSDPDTELGVYSATDVGNEQATFVMGRYWNVNITSGSLNGTVNIRFYFDPNDSDTLEAVAERWNDQNVGSTAFVSGRRWFTMNTGTFDHSTGDLTAAGITSSQELFPASQSTEDGIDYVQFNGLFSLTGGGQAYTIGENSVVLPVELLTFNATLIEKDVHLTWQTATEVNSDLFEIQRSLDKKKWISIGLVEAAGFSNEPLEYLEYDFTPNTGINYYRLKAIDRDGSFEFSEIQAVKVTDNIAQGIYVYPIPTLGQLMVELPELHEMNMLVITNILGEHITTLDIGGKARLQLDLSDLPGGVYNASFLGQNTVSVKVIKTQ